MRTKPIQRDEIRFGYRPPGITTAPASSMRKDRDRLLRPVNPKLWAPLLQSLNKELRKSWKIGVKYGLDNPNDPPQPVTAPNWRWYDQRCCRHCDRKFYRRSDSGNFIYCSDKCAGAARSTNFAKARSRRRATARADRKCEICGEPIKAQRSTMRFCSVRCRVANHRGK
jgi:hypothetical protein